METQFQSVKNLMRACSRTQKRSLLNSLLWDLCRISPSEFNAFAGSRARTRVISLTDNNLINQERDYTRECKAFKEAFPDKDCEFYDEIGNYDLPALIAEIKKSDFLTQNHNLGLQWCIDNYQKIMAGAYRNFLKNAPTVKHDFIRHNYSPDVFKETDISKIQF